GGFDLLPRRAHVASGDDFAFEVERVGLLAKGNREIVALRRVQHSPADLGRFPQRDREDAAGERIERAAVADLRLRFAGLAQDSLDGAYRRGRAEPDRLVEDDPAVEHLTSAATRISRG